MALRGPKRRAVVTARARWLRDAVPWISAGNRDSRRSSARSE